MHATIEGTAHTIAEGETFNAAGATDRGSRNMRVSSQWFSRPADQRFLTLDALYEHAKHSADESRPFNVDVKTIQVQARQDDPDRLALVIPERTRSGIIESTTEPTHWSFGQLCQLTSVPAGYLRKLPAPIAGINLQYALANFRSELVKAYVRVNGKTELRAATGPNYGRIADHEVVKAVQRIAGDGTGRDFAWKVPGLMDWSTMRYNPHVDISTETTTLFASDRDVFIFLVDDRHPIEIGKLPDGSPDLVFRGFYVWNSEVGSKTFGLAAFYLRGVCGNRCLWGVEGFKEITFRHSSGAPARFMSEIRPALESFSNRSTATFLAGVNEAKSAKVAGTPEEQGDFLRRRGFTEKQSADIIGTVLKEEGHPPASVWDFVQGITACARRQGHQDERLELERKAGKILDQVSRT